MRDWPNETEMGHNKIIDMMILIKQQAPCK